MSRIQVGDRMLFFLIVILIVFGIAMLASASIGFVGRNTLTPTDIILRQLLLGLGGGSLLFFITLNIRYTAWKTISPILFILSLGLLALLLVPGLGASFGGATRWITFGPLSLQPAEPAKLAFIMYLASWLASKKRDVGSFRFGFLPFLVMLGVLAVLFIMQPDLGTFAMIALIGSVLFFIGGGKIKHLALFGIGAAIFFALLIVSTPYRLERVNIFFHPETALQGSGYQLHQAKIAIGSGSISGKGFGQSIQKFHYLPEPAGDAIFAVIGEELGFVGVVALIMLFLFFLWRSVIILYRTADEFARLLGAGIVIMIVLQSFVNMAALVGIIPMTGIPLVFVSQGGSSLAIALGASGILLNISKHSTKY